MMHHLIVARDEICECADGPAPAALTRGHIIISPPWPADAPEAFDAGLALAAENTHAFFEGRQFCQASS